MITNLINTKGKAVTNQIVITEQGKTSFQSYNSLIVEVSENEIIFHGDYAYSNTTVKHRNKFLSDILGITITTKEVDKMIKTSNYTNYNVSLKET